MRHAWTRGWTLGLGVALAVAAAGTAVAQPVEAQALRELYEKLMAPEIDTGRYLDVAGKTLAYEDLTVTFVVGAVHPVVRSDGKIMGLAFAGKGELTFDPPDARERQQVERHLKAVPYVHGFASAWIMATDDTVDRLLGEGGEWATGGGAPVRAENIHVSRHKLYRDKLWDEAGPSLEMDVLHDLYGDGFQGGHVFAEFAVDPVRWLTYYRNPRGALFAGEEVSVFTHAGRVWFFAVTGAVDQVSPQRDAFEAMVRSIRVEASAPAPAPAADAVVTAPTSTTGSGFTWQKPAAWRDDPNASSMRVASFIISDGDMQGEVAVTRFPGDVGGLLSNINRWRGQVGLAPIQTIEDQPIQEVKVADLSSALLDLIESDVEDPTEARRMVVAIVPQGGMTWFFKMTGPSALLEKKAAAYNAFLHSIHQADE